MTSEYPSARRTLTHTAIAVLATSTIVLASAVAACPPTHTMSTPPEACTSEDQSTSCYWDAKTMGNGKGTSFVVGPDGRVIYLKATLPRKTTPITR